MDESQISSLKSPVTPVATRLTVIGISVILSSILVLVGVYAVFQLVYGGKTNSVPLLRELSSNCPISQRSGPYDPQHKVTFDNLGMALENPNKVCKLDLSNRDLDNFPRDILKFTRLRILLLRFNHLSELPDEISALRSLESIDLTGNNFQRVPRGLTRMGWLDQLSLNSNPIKTIPTQLFGLTELSQLHMDETGISEIPPTIRYLPKLEILYLRRNKLTYLPAEIGLLTKLKVLNLIGNNFPEEERARIRKLLPNAQIIFD